MKKTYLFLVILSCFAASSSHEQTPFTPGNLVVVRIGDGSVSLNTRTQPVFLDEYTTSGNLVRSIAMPTAANGANNMFTLPANSTGIGMLKLSMDGKYLTTIGFGAPVSTSGGNILSTPNFGRTIALIDHNGVIDTRTILSVATVGGFYPYSAVTTNGTDIWASFNATGIVYTTRGATSINTVVDGINNINRTVHISNGQLYFSTSTGALRSVGSGLPTSTAISTNLPGIPVGGEAELLGESDYFFADLNPLIPGDDVVYIAQINQNALQKYSFDGLNWVLNGTIGADIDDYAGITGVISPSDGSVTLYITRKVGVFGDGGGELVKLIDESGYNGTFSGVPTFLIAAPVKTVFRGIAWAPAGPVQFSVSIAAKAYLQGAYNMQLARHGDVTNDWAAILNNHALNQPFDGVPFNYTGVESVASGFFTSTTAPTDILDWVLLELHDATTSATVVGQKAAFIREDGMIVDLDGVSNPSFIGIASGNYYLVIRQRNHLAIRSATTIAVNNSPALYDFTTNQGQAFQDPSVTSNAAMADLGGGLFGLWGGDVTNNGIVQFTGTGNDSEALLTILGNQASVLTGVYNKGDLNLDGKVRYTGLNNDAGILLKSLRGKQDDILMQHQ